MLQSISVPSLKHSIMKKAFCFAVLFTLMVSCFAQYKEQYREKYKVDIRESLLQKSKRQKTAAYITLGGSVVTFVTGILILSSIDDLPDLEMGLVGAGLVFASAGLCGASLALFIKSNRTEKEARRLTVHLNKPVPVYTGIQKTVLPYSVGVSIAIR
jgi:hypothetical protein